MILIVVMHHMFHLSETYNHIILDENILPLLQIFSVTGETKDKSFILTNYNYWLAMAYLIDKSSHIIAKIFSRLIASLISVYFHTQ